MIAAEYRHHVEVGEPAPVTATARSHGVTPSAASRWVKTARERGLPMPAEQRGSVYQTKQLMGSVSGGMTSQASAAAVPASSRSPKPAHGSRTSSSPACAAGSSTSR
jgi:transposase-like protein